MCSHTHSNPLQIAEICSPTHSNILPYHLQWANRSPAIHCNTLRHTAIHCNTLRHTAIHCKITYSQRIEPKRWNANHIRRANPTRQGYCIVLQCVAVCCSVLQCVAVCILLTHPQETLNFLRKQDQKLYVVLTILNLWILPVLRINALVFQFADFE